MAHHVDKKKLRILYGAHPAMITKWKKQLLEEMPQVFASRRSAAVRAQEDVTGTLYQEIVRLKVELDWLKKSGNLDLMNCGNSLIRGIHGEFSYFRQGKTPALFLHL